jgi:Flp pilus assembly pilin Flp
VNQALRVLKRLLLETGGPTAVEYAMMLALIMALCMPTLSFFGPNCARNFLIVVRSLSGS